MTLKEFDAVVIGAGFAGMHMLHLLREGGYTVRAYEAGSNVGGTWYWNRYPGARCDSPSLCYCYTFSEELYKNWTWSSVFPEQPEILSYLNYVADKLDLRRDIQFNTRVTSAHYDESNNRWIIRTYDGNLVLAKYFIPGIGNLTVSNTPNIKNLESFEGKTYHTSHWPHEKVEFKGKRVGVFGTGSSGIQSIPVIAKEAEHLTVFQRTPQYTFPARNRPLEPDEINGAKEDVQELRCQIRESPAGVAGHTIINNYSALDDSPEERQKVYEQIWQFSGGGLLSAYNDLQTNEEANETLAEFIRSKIKEIVKDPETAEKLLPTYLVGGKRPVMDTDYYETYNRENVSLVDLKKTPILESTPKGLRTTEAEYKLDIIVFATGFDAMTGPLMNLDIRGRNGVLLKEKWDGGANLKTLLGISNVGFPNMFNIAGPHFPSAVNAPPVNEVIVEWIFDCIQYLEEHNIGVIEATTEAEEAWTNHVNELGASSIYAKVDSWYTGANIEGKPRAFYTYPGDFQTYQEKFNDVASKDYEGFSLISLPKTSVKGK